MDRETLEKFIYKSELIEFSNLSEIEKALLNQYVCQKKSIDVICDDMGLTNERATHLLENAYDKLIFTLKGFKNQAKLLAGLVQKNIESQTTTKCAGDTPAARESTLAVNAPEQKDVDLSYLRLSQRAIGGLQRINVHTLKQLLHLTWMIYIASVILEQKPITKLLQGLLNWE